MRHSVDQYVRAAGVPVDDDGEPLGRLSPRGREFFHAAQLASHIRPRLDRDYLVKGWLDRGAFSIVYGPPNAGKTFLALNFADHVAADTSWQGNRVRGGMVFYISAEGGAGIKNRIAALPLREDAKHPLWLLPVSMDLCHLDADVLGLWETVNHFAIRYRDCALIVVDTLARVMGSGDENSAPDMGALIANVDAIRDVTGAHVMVIHHTGKDVARGARGHSALRAAADTEIELAKDDDGVITAAARKQRDMPAGAEFTYRLAEVDLGRDQDGDPVTTCTVEPAEPVERKARLGPKQQSVFDALHEYVADFGTPNPGGTGWPEPGTVRTVDWPAFLGFCAGRMSNASEGDRKRTVRYAVSELQSKALVAMNEDRIWATK